MNISNHQEKILLAIPQAQARLSVEWVSREFLAPHVGRIPQQSGIKSLINAGILICNPVDDKEFKIA